MDVSAVYGPPAKDSTPTKKSDSLLGDTMGDFLNLFVSQIKYQDPLSPMQGADFLAQTAQITTVEQLVKLNQNTRNSLAASLLGKQVEAEVSSGSGQPVLHSGMVVMVDYSESGEPLLSLEDGTSVKLSDLKNMSQLLSSL